MSATVIPVKLPQAAYDIVIASGQLEQLGSQMRTAGLKGRVLVVSHPVIFDFHGEGVTHSLKDAGFDVHTCLLPAGEEYKTLGSLSQIHDAALAAGLERSSTIVALGGGVIGDMAGFAAATWLRGIPFVQVPTSLLAMVDASIGGKTGVNHAKGKNLIGAFHQPRLVWIDPQFLATLPTRELQSALAEVIKYGVIQDPELFAFLETLPTLSPYQAFDPAALEHILIRSAESKAQVVMADEKESGLRAILNYGHTLGHALESLTHYRQYLHGEAVAVGMVAAGAIAQELGWWDPDAAHRQQELIRRCGLPVSWPDGIPDQQVQNALQADKKVKDGRVRFILPTRIGHVQITDAVPNRVIQAALDRIRA